MKLEIVTPEKVVFSNDVAMVTLPGAEGDFGVLDNHVPLITALNAGEVNVFDRAESTAPKAKFRLKSGIVQVTSDTCTVLSDSCEVLNDNFAETGASVAQIKKAK
jgi:F-type H+-transporting ATPase subunit epsilon